MKSIIVIFSCVLVLLSSCKKKDLIANPGYTIAIVSAYSKGGWKGSPARIAFSYIINGKSFTKSYSDGYAGWPVPSTGSYNTGDKYMGVYNLNDLNTCRFLFDYPIQDSAGYRWDVNYFKNHSPQ